MREEVTLFWLKPSCKAQWKGEEDNAGRKNGKTTSRTGQAWSLPSSRRQCRTGKKWRKLIVKSSVVPQRCSCQETGTGEVTVISPCHTSSWDEKALSPCHTKWWDKQTLSLCHTRWWDRHSHLAIPEDEISRHSHFTIPGFEIRRQSYLAIPGHEIRRRFHFTIPGDEIRRHFHFTIPGDEIRRQSYLAIPGHEVNLFEWRLFCLNFIITQNLKLKIQKKIIIWYYTQQMNWHSQLKTTKMNTL